MGIQPHQFQHLHLHPEIMQGYVIYGIGTSTKKQNYSHQLHETLKYITQCLRKVSLCAELTFFLNKFQLLFKVNVLYQIGYIQRYTVNLSTKPCSNRQLHISA